MIKKRSAVFMACALLALLAAACQSQKAAAAEPTAYGECGQTEAELEAVNAQAASLTPPPQIVLEDGVLVSRMVSQCDNGYIVYPHVVSGETASAVNEATIACIEEYAARQSCMVFTKYKVEYNKNGLLSFRMSLYDLYGKDSAALQVVPFTFDMVAGKRCGIKDLFGGADERWRGILPEIVAAQAEKRGMTLLNDLLPIADSQEYYISADGVVLMYHVYEIATYDAGAPEFVIPVTQLADLIGDGSPLAGMLEDARVAEEETTEEAYAVEVS